MNTAGNAAIANEILDNPLRDLGCVARQQPSARWFHARLPGYAPTPLHDVPGLARRLGVGRVLVKDEATRLGLPAFKMLGASWASYRALCERLGREPADWQAVSELAEAFLPLRPLTLATATDGNHGRAVARMAKLLGFSARIWVPAGTAPARVAAIESEGASVTEIAGGYDDAVAAAAAAADDRTLVVSDTSWEGYDRVPRFVIEGYATILEEVDEQAAAAGIPTPDMAVVPIGVGAFAAAVAAHYRRAAGAGTELVGAEPVDAACVLKSARSGGIVTLTEPQHSIMAGLNCGTPSPIAWPAVSKAFDRFVSVNDDQAVEAMRLLAEHGIAAGESAAAPLAALLVMQRAGSLADAADKTVLLFSTEGVTDPDFYAREVTAKLVRTAT